MSDRPWSVLRLWVFHLRSLPLRRRMQSTLLSCQYVYANLDEYRLQSHIRTVKHGIAKYLGVEV